MISPGATLGVLGGGQLGRMFVRAAQSQGYVTVVLDPDSASPAGHVAHHHIQTDYADERGLAQLAQCCAAVTIEFENVPAAALQSLASHCAIAPSAGSVEVCQDRVLEKAHFARCGVPCAPFALIESEKQLSNVGAELYPGILKTARLGYDGKGQVPVPSQASLEASWRALGQVACVLEQWLPLALELSVVVARSADGKLVHLPVQQNLHFDGILAVTQVPAPDVSVALQHQAIEAAEQIAECLNYVGVLCVEFFVRQDGSLVANEMAPRPHNSGHYSVDACSLSQFDLQLRTLIGAPMVMPRLHCPALMLNLLGDLWLGSDEIICEPSWASVLALRGTHLHLYDKHTPRPGRKMGHLTVTAPEAGEVRATALKAAALLGIAAF